MITSHNKSHPGGHEGRKGNTMKIRLYAAPGFSGAASTLRKLDGMWTAIDDTTLSGPIDYVHAAGQPVNQAMAESRKKEPLLINRAMARLYGIPDDVELYDCLEDNKCK